MRAAVPAWAWAVAHVKAMAPAWAWVVVRVKTAVPAWVWDAAHVKAMDREWVMVDTEGMDPAMVADQCMALAVTPHRSDAAAPLVQ